MDVSAVRRFGVIGAGQMGRGIAQVAAASGYDVVLCDSTKALAEADPTNAGLRRGLERRSA